MADNTPLNGVHAHLCCGVTYAGVWWSVQPPRLGGAPAAAWLLLVLVLWKITLKLETNSSGGIDKRLSQYGAATDT